MKYVIFQQPDLEGEPRKSVVIFSETMNHKTVAEFVIRGMAFEQDTYLEPLSAGFCHKTPTGRWSVRVGSETMRIPQEKPIGPLAERDAEILSRG